MKLDVEALDHSVLWAMENFNGFQADNLNLLSLFSIIFSKRGNDLAGVELWNLFLPT